MVVCATGLRRSIEISIGSLYQWAVDILPVLRKRVQSGERPAQVTLYAVLIGDPDRASSRSSCHSYPRWAAQ